MQKNFYILPLMLMILLLSGSCKNLGKMIPASGKIIQKEFKFNTEAEGLSVHNNFRIILDSTIAPGTARVVADENAMAEIQLKMDGDDVMIRFRDNHSISELEVKIYIAANGFKEFSTTGIASITASVFIGAKELSFNALGKSSMVFENISADETDIDVIGNSEITLKGRTGKLEAKATGASLIETKELISRTAKINSTGTSRIILYVTDFLKGKCIGTSRVTYYGNPKAVDVSTIGTASLDAR